MNSNYIVLVILLVLLLIFGGFIILGNMGGDQAQNQQLLNNNNNPISSGTATSTSEISVRETVIYNGKSFSPNNFTVNRGESVRFVNQGTGGMSIASDPHPTHTNYPEFDQYKTSQKGEKTFVFNFEKVGTWGFHDHLNPAARGTVTVNP
jgi:plastocyanin